MRTFMRCSSCGTELPERVVYCPTCGAVTPYQVSGSGVSPYDLTAVSSPSATSEFKPATDYGSPPYGLSSQNPYEAPLPPPPPSRPHSHIKFGLLIGLLS